MEYAPIFQPTNVLERLVRRYLNYWHGEGAPHQYQFYRCLGCHRLVNWKRIRAGGCDCDLGNKIKPAKLSWVEKGRILLLPWTI